MKHWDELTKVQQLQNYWSDYHKDFYGFRPSHPTNEQWNDEAYLQSQIDFIDNEMALLKGTFAGREHLRENGWVVEETDPELVERAAFLAQERARMYDEWMTKWEVV